MVYTFHRCCSGPDETSPGWRGRSVQFRLIFRRDPVTPPTEEQMKEAIIDKIRQGENPLARPGWWVCHDHTANKRHHFEIEESDVGWFR